MANKIKYGLSKVYYAKATIDTSTGTATYATPVALPGAVSLSMDPSGESNKFYADNVAYATFAANAGYEGELEIALISDDFRKDILGEVVDSDIQVEKASASAQPFALLFQFEGDQDATRHVFYNVTAARPNVGSKTTEESVEVQTETLKLQCGSIYNTKLADNIVKGKISDKTKQTYTDWFSSVHQPSNGGQTT